MIPEDKDRFSEKLYRTARVMDRRIDADTVSAYFRDLSSFPLDIVEQAIDIVMVLKSESDDLYDQRAMPIVPEIRREAKNLMIEVRRKAGCEKCNWTGYILIDRPKGQAAATPCECLQEVFRVKKEMERKGRKK